MEDKDKPGVPNPPYYYTVQRHGGGAAHIFAGEISPNVSPKPMALVHGWNEDPEAIAKMFVAAPVCVRAIRAWKALAEFEARMKDSLFVSEADQALYAELRGKADRWTITALSAIEAEPRQAHAVAPKAQLAIPEGGDDA